MGNRLSPQNENPIFRKSDMFYYKYSQWLVWLCPSVPLCLRSYFLCLPWCWLQALSSSQSRDLTIFIRLKSPQLYLIGLKVYGFVSKQQTEDKNTVFLGALSWLKSISSRLSWNLISLKNNNKLSIYLVCTTLFTALMTRSCQSVSYFKYPR